MPIKARNTDIIWSATTFVSDPGGAGVKRDDTKFFKAPFSIEVTDIRVVPVQAWVAAAAVNDGFVTVKRNATGTALGTLSVVTALAANADTQLAATLDATTKFLAKDDWLTVSTGANLGAGTANAPEQYITVYYRARQQGI